jgi:hypothetical protein
MDRKPPVTRRSFFGKGIAAALALGGLAVPVSTLAKANLPATKRDPSREYSMKVFYKDGKPYKVCYYDQNGALLYCDSV